MVPIIRTLVFPVLLISWFVPRNCYGEGGGGGGEVLGMFVFGSSLVDNGNNNFLQNSAAKADYFPYGIDFPSGPSGRFTNGKNVIDLLSHHLSLPFIPPFSHPSTKGPNILHGVNFASAASGILDHTGSLARNVTSLRQQIRNFEEVTLADLEGQVGVKSRDLLSKYLFVVGTGGNDYSFNYFLRPSPSPSPSSSKTINSNNNNTISLQLFTANLTNSLSNYLKKLYNLGGRKFVLMAVNPIGCSPMVNYKMNQGGSNTNNGCIQGLNKAAHLFNARLQSQLGLFHQQMPGSTLVFVNSYKIIRDIIRNPASKGFKDTSNACCEVMSPREGGNGILCKRDGLICENRNIHVFFDGLHPTEAVNVQIATKAYTSSLLTEVFPINIKQLTML